MKFVARSHNILHNLVPARLPLLSSYDPPGGHCTIAMVAILLQLKNIKPVPTPEPFYWFSLLLRTFFSTACSLSSRVSGKISGPQGSLLWLLQPKQPPAPSTSLSSSSLFKPPLCIISYCNHLYLKLYYVSIDIIVYDSVLLLHPTSIIM